MVKMVFREAMCVQCARQQCKHSGTFFDVLFRFVGAAEGSRTQFKLYMTAVRDKCRMSYTKRNLLSRRENVAGGKIGICPQINLGKFTPKHNLK